MKASVIRFKQNSQQILTSNPPYTFISKLNMSIAVTYFFRYTPSSGHLSGIFIRGCLLTQGSLRRGRWQPVSAHRACLPRGIHKLHAASRKWIQKARILQGFLHLGSSISYCEPFHFTLFEQARKHSENEDINAWNEENAISIEGWWEIRIHDQ